ncbi:MAG: hypothetical protein ABII18_09005 [bacterium]|nr:hypothetical protein [bacterium]MBU1918457.1 hypothetical protein [bacterium]
MFNIPSHIPLPVDQDSWDYLLDNVDEETRALLPKEFTFSDASVVLDFFASEYISFPQSWFENASTQDNSVLTRDMEYYARQMGVDTSEEPVAQQTGVDAQIPVTSLASQTSRELQLRLEVFKSTVSENYYGTSINKINEELLRVEDYQGNFVSGYAVDLFNAFQRSLLFSRPDPNVFSIAQKAVANVLEERCLVTGPNVSQKARDIVLFFLNEINKRTGGAEIGWDYKLLRGFHYYTNTGYAEQKEIIQGQRMLGSAVEYLQLNIGINDVKGDVVKAFDASSLSTDLREHLISVQDNLYEATGRVRFMNTNLEIASFIKTFEGNRDDVEWIYSQMGIPQDAASGEYLIDEIYSQMGILSANEWLTITAEEAMQRNLHETSYPVSPDVWKHCFELARAKKLLDMKQYAFTAFAVVGSIAAVIGGTALGGPVGGMAAGVTVAGLTGGYDVYKTRERLIEVETANVAQRLAGFPLGDDAYVDLLREEYHYSIGAAVGNTALAAVGGYANQFITGSRLTRITLQGLYGGLDGAGSWKLDARQSDLDYLQRRLEMSGGNPEDARSVAIQGLVFSVGLGVAAGAGAEIVFGGAGRQRPPGTGGDRVHVVTKFDGSAEMIDPQTQARVPVKLKQTETGMTAELPDGRVVALDVQDQQVVGVVRSQKRSQTADESVIPEGRRQTRQAAGEAEPKKAAIDEVGDPIFDSVPQTKDLSGEELGMLMRDYPEDYSLARQFIDDPQAFWAHVDAGDADAMRISDTYGLKRTAELPDVNPAARQRTETGSDELPQQGLHAEGAGDGGMGSDMTTPARTEEPGIELKTGLDSAPEPHAAPTDSPRQYSRNDLETERGIHWGTPEGERLGQYLDDQSDFWKAVDDGDPEAQAIAEKYHLQRSGQTVPIRTSFSESELQEIRRQDGALGKAAQKYNEDPGIFWKRHREGAPAYRQLVAAHGLVAPDIEVRIASDGSIVIGDRAYLQNREIIDQFDMEAESTADAQYEWVIDARRGTQMRGGERNNFFGVEHETHFLKFKDDWHIKEKQGMDIQDRTQSYYQYYRFLVENKHFEEIEKIMPTLLELRLFSEVISE